MRTPRDLIKPAAYLLVSLTGFAPTASHFLFTRFARPSGQPAAVTSLRYVCSRERESNQRESAPGIRVSLRSTSLAPVLFRGSSRWAIPGPSFLVWHPCQTPLSTAPPLLAALALRASLRLLLRFATLRPPDGIRNRVHWTICGGQSEQQRLSVNAKASRPWAAPTGLKTGQIYLYPP